MPTDSLQIFGYYVIDPGLALPMYKIDPDAQVRCLSYLVTRIPEFNLAPKGAKFTIIPDEYLGGPYPAIGMYTETFIDTSEKLTQLSFMIASKLKSLIAEIGLIQLIKFSSSETLRWQDVLTYYGYPHDT
jgi:hypothetical protein